MCSGVHTAAEERNRHFSDPGYKAACLDSLMLIHMMYLEVLAHHNEYIGAKQMICCLAVWVIMHPSLGICAYTTSDMTHWGGLSLYNFSHALKRYS